MRETVFKKVLSLLLCGVLIAGALPQHIHAEQAEGESQVEQIPDTTPETQPAGLGEAERSAVVNRPMDSWVFPLPEEFFDDIVDFAGCRGWNENALYGGANGGCTHSDHANLFYGSKVLIVNAGSTQPVFAPAAGTLYRSGQPDQSWGDAAVLEVPVDGNFSYYIIMGSVTADAAVASGSYVAAGSTIGYAGGEFRFTDLMDCSGAGAQIAGNVSAELEMVESHGWLLNSTGTGFVCVNPSAYTTTQYPNYQVGSHSGPITYSFAAAQTPDPTTETTPIETVPPETTPIETVPPQTEHVEHIWDNGTMTQAPSHTADGLMTYTCTVCGAAQTQVIPATADHVYDRQVISDQYLASNATCSSPATYYKSCVCGEKGTEVFTYGQTAPHTYSDQWSRNETDHWRQAVCEHTGEATDLGPHKWDDGVITKDAGHSVDGEKVYTCTVCGYQKTERIPGQPHEYNQEVVDQKYLVSAATCTSGAVYYKSCVCGLAGTETFTYGHSAGHTFSDRWNSDELQHWHPATCEHTGERSGAADHAWGPGEITVQPTATSKGVQTFTCTVCGRTKTEEVAPSEHRHTFSTAWMGNTTYHWHPATCEHTNVVSGLGEHVWNQGVVTQWASHTAPGQKVYTCTVCGAQKTETISQTHTYDQMIASSAYLASNATCTSPAVYYKSCSCGAKGTETFTYGNALGHTASGTYGKDVNYHWNVCSRCGAKGDLVPHSFDANGKCTTCGYSKADSHVHTSHLTRVAAKAATCTEPGNVAYYICDCGQWFSDVTCATPITDQQSVVLPATGHVDKDNNGRCDVCKARLDNTVEYQMTEGGDSTWLNTSEQGMVFRSNADFAKFDRVEVDGATVASTNYSVSQGSTIVELNTNYLKRLSLGYHSISIVAKDGKATTGFTIKQGATAAKGGSGFWGVLLFLAVVTAIAIPVAYGVYYYRKRTGGGFDD